jgi:hypothetical protein
MINTRSCGCDRADATSRRKMTTTRTETATHPSDARLTRIDRVAELYAGITAATRVFLSALAECDRLRDWSEEGFTSCAEWLSWRLGITRNTANEKVRVAHALERLPEIAGAMERGKLSFSKVRALTRVATADNEHELLPYALAVSAAGLERFVRSWREIDGEDPAARERRLHARRTFSVFPGEDGLYVVRGRLTPEVAAVLMRAVEAASDALYREDAGPRDAGPRAVSGTDGPDRELCPEDDADRRAAAQRRADALGLIAERALAAGFADDRAPVSGSRAERYQVVLHVGADRATLDDGAPLDAGATLDADTTLDDGATLDDGTSVTAVTARRLTCDAARVDVTHAADGTILDVGRRTLTVPPSIRRALEARDGGCRFPGCGSRFTDAHHVVHWADGGETSLGNLVLLCRRHHRSVHEGGVTVAIDRDQRIVFFTPDGRAMAACGRIRAGAGAGRAGYGGRGMCATKGADGHGGGGPARGPSHGGSPRPTYKSDALVPWAIEAAAWEALDPPDAA